MALALVPDQPNPEVVRLLEKFLKWAREGKLESVAIVALEKDGSSIDATSDTRNFQTLIGGICLLQHKMMNNSAEIHDYGVDS